MRTSRQLLSLLILGFAAVFSGACDAATADLGKIFKQAIFNQDSDGNVRVTGDALEKQKRDAEARELTGKAFSVDNLKKGPDMDMKGIDRALELDATNIYRHLDKASMLVAAGQSPTTALGNTVDQAMKNYDKDNPPGKPLPGGEKRMTKADFQDDTTWRFAAQLGDLVRWNLPDGPNSKLKTEFCNQANLVKARAAVPGSEMSKALFPNSHVDSVLKRAEELKCPKA